MVDRIREAQERLARILGEARAGEDRELARQVREHGEQLARLMHGLLRLAALHAPTNNAFDRPVQEVMRLTADLCALLGAVQVLCVEGQVYVNDLRTRFDVDPEHAVALGEGLARHNVGGITFHSPLDDSQVRTMMHLLAGQSAADRRRTHLQEAFARAGLASVELEPLQQFRLDDAAVERNVDEVYQDTAAMVADALAELESGRLPNPLPIRRVIHQLIAIIATHDGARLAFEADPSLPAFARHTVMVTNLSLTIGRAAGLPASSLADLGIAAVLHDAGYAVRPEDRICTFAEHTRAALDIFLRQRGFHQARVRRMLAMVTHHRAITATPRPSLYARVLHIADDYDLLTRIRPNGQAAHPPPHAMRLMAALGGVEYDPVLLQAFVNVMGPYPPGSVLELADRRWVMSISGVREPSTFDRPLCRLARLRDGSTPSEHVEVDLAQGGEVARVVHFDREGP